MKFAYYHFSKSFFGGLLKSIPHLYLVVKVKEGLGVPKHCGLPPCTTRRVQWVDFLEVSAIPSYHESLSDGTGRLCF